jgi:hypothetical protein
MVPDTNPVSSFLKPAAARYKAGLLTGLWKGKRKDIKIDIVQQQKLFTMVATPLAFQNEKRLTSVQTGFGKYNIVQDMKMSVRDI